MSERIFRAKRIGPILCYTFDGRLPRSLKDQRSGSFSFITFHRRQNCSNKASHGVL